MSGHVPTLLKRLGEIEAMRDEQTFVFEKKYPESPKDTVQVAGVPKYFARLIILGMIHETEGVT